MKFFSLILALGMAVPMLSIAQDLAPPEAAPASANPGPSKPKFALPFDIPGLKGKKEEDPSPEATEGSEALSGESGPAPGAPAAGGLQPGSMPSPDEKIDFLQRSNFVLSKIRNNFRQLDPFGMPMDPTNPTESPALATQYEEVEEVPVLTNSSLTNALGTLPISGIYPNKNIIVIGARSFSRGDQFGMKLEELTIRLRFEGVRGQKIYFKDLDTQEVASVDFSPTPKEFEPITSNNSAPKGEGIVPMDSLFIIN